MTTYDVTSTIHTITGTPLQFHSVQDITDTEMDDQFVKLKNVVKDAGGVLYSNHGNGKYIIVPSRQVDYVDFTATEHVKDTEEGATP